MATATPIKPRAAAKKAALPPKAPTLGGLVDEMWAKREAKRQLDDQAKVIETQLNELQDQLLERMQAEGIDKATGQHASVGVSTTVVANIKDWDDLCAYVKKTGHFHLFQRRISDPAFRELLEQPRSKGVPGLEPFSKTKLNLRSL